MRKAITLAAIPFLLSGSLLLAAPSPTKTSTKKKASAAHPAAAKRKSAAHPAAKAGSTAARKSRTASSASRRSGRRPAARRTTRQMQPTPDRYRQIQSALVSKGYLQGEPSGQWDEASQDALRRFQKDQNLEPSGKLNSLSLIALGLGPKHEMAPGNPPAISPPATPAPGATPARPEN